MGVEQIGLLGEPHRLAGQRLGLRQLASPGADLRAGAAPEHLGEGVVGRGRVLARLREALGLVELAQAGERVREQRGRRREVAPLAHLLEDRKGVASDALGRLEVAGEHLDVERLLRAHRRAQREAEAGDRLQPLGDELPPVREVAEHRLQRAELDARRCPRMNGSSTASS